jgi:hypothetical protein
MPSTCARIHPDGANIIVRLGHGAYTAVDPFVREMWLERKVQLAACDSGANPK